LLSLIGLASTMSFTQEIQIARNKGFVCVTEQVKYSYEILTMDEVSAHNSAINSIPPESRTTAYRYY
jgi:hypothetical protein